MSRKIRPIAALTLVLAAGLPLLAPATAMAQDKVYAKVDGRDITEADLKLATSELGPNLAQVPPEQRKLVLIQYLIENGLLAAAGDKAGLASAPDFEKRLGYYRVRALRDAYFDKSVFEAVTEAEAKAYFDKKLAEIPPSEELRARHILVKTKAEADDLAGKIKAGGDFASLAKEKSTDTGSGANGGDLGFFGKGQMVKPFEDAAMALKAGEVSAPVESQFGWHIIKLEEKRNKPLPSFDDVKERITADLQRQKAETLMTDLRKAAKIEYVDPDIKKAMDAMTATAPATGEAAAPATGEAVAPATGEAAAPATGEAAAPATGEAAPAVTP